MKAVSALTVGFLAVGFIFTSCNEIEPEVETVIDRSFEVAPSDTLKQGFQLYADDEVSGRFSVLYGSIDFYVFDSLSYEGWLLGQEPWAEYQALESEGDSVFFQVDAAGNFFMVLDNGKDTQASKLVEVRLERTFYPE